LRRSTGGILQHGGPAYDDVIWNFAALETAKSQTPGRGIQTTNIKATGDRNKIEKGT
jgi:hypothetical protein